MPDSKFKTEKRYYEDEHMFHMFIPHVMGTRFDSLLIDESNDHLSVISEHIESVLFQLEKVLNRFDVSSEVGRINANPQKTILEISNDLGQILSVSKEYYEKTAHLFDVTLSNFTKLSLDGNLLRFLQPDIQLDFGGIAKGYALRQIKSLLEEQRIRRAFVDFGNSSILTIGSHPYGNSWRVGLENPDTGISLATYDLVDLSMSTSGNTAQYTGHIKNVQTGEYVTDKKLCTVLSKDPLDAEVLSTVMMVCDEQKLKEILNNFKGVKVNTYNI